MELNVKSVTERYLESSQIPKITHRIRNKLTSEIKLWWWYVPTIPVFGRLRQEDHRFKVNLGYTASSGPV
jgi:hypothetical protein